MKIITNTRRGCPHCNSLLCTGNLIEDCLEGTRFWSDGKLDAHGLPTTRAYARCPACHEPFKMSDARRNNEPALMGTAAPKPEWIDGKGFLQLIELAESAEDREEEKRLRIDYWLHLNDGLRNGHLRLRPVIDEAWKPALDQNLARLAPLLNEMIPEERLRKGELLRERGFCDEALKMLTGLPAKLQWAADRIATHAAAGNEALFGLDKGSDGWTPIPPARGNNRSIADLIGLGKRPD